MISNKQIYLDVLEHNQLQLEENYLKQDRRLHVSSP